MKDLSGGQKARVALAELTLNAPDVIILVSKIAFAQVGILKIRIIKCYYFSEILLFLVQF